jgi:hypothetical protein
LPSARWRQYGFWFYSDRGFSVREIIKTRCLNQGAARPENAVKIDEAEFAWS